MDKSINEKWIVNPDEYEDLCVCVKSKTAYIYAYPFVKDVWKSGAKVITRSGKTVKKVCIGSSNGEDVIVGILDGQELKWDAAGRFQGPYIEDENDLMICERYWYKDWRNYIKLSNAEWELRFGRPHPTLNYPKTTNNIHPMARKKDKDTIIERPSHYCMNCIFWTSCGELEHRDYSDNSWGSCSHNGYSKCPPMFTCNGWSDGKESILDKFEPF